MISTWLKKLRNDNKGSPALEFALIAPLFFAAVFSTFEIGRALYDRNQLAAAAAIAMRTVAIDNEATDNEIETAIKAKLNRLDHTKLNIAVCNKSVASQTFKEINLSYNFDLLVKVGHYFNGFTLKATRYAPAAGGSGSGSACTTP